MMDWDKRKGNKIVKKNIRLISSHLDQTSLVNKGFIIHGQENFFLVGQTSSVANLLARVANQNTGFTSSCPPAEGANNNFLFQILLPFSFKILNSSFQTRQIFPWEQSYIYTVQNVGCLWLFVDVSMPPNWVCP